MTKTKRPPIPKLEPLYTGAQACDFRPEWSDAGDMGLLALLESCWACDYEELTPPLVLADFLADRSDPRERWVRIGVELWQQAGTLKLGRRDWDYDQAKAALGPVCKTAAGWRLACLWGHLVAYHAPSAWGEPMGKTWCDVRVGIVSRSVWWWALGFLSGSQAYAAGSQAYAAGRQAYAAGRQKRVWRYARSLWQVCVERLPELEGA